MSKEPDNPPNVVRLNPHKNKGKKAASAKVCPICASPSGGEKAGEYAPFCSKRCANSDLGNWLDGKYAISTDDGPDFDDNEDD